MGAAHRQAKNKKSGGRRLFCTVILFVSQTHLKVVFCPFLEARNSTNLPLETRGHAVRPTRPGDPCRRHKCEVLSSRVRGATSLSLFFIDCCLRRGMRNMADFVVGRLLKGNRGARQEAQQIRGDPKEMKATVLRVMEAAETAA
uniref:Uncharacterized protein n=1 Tax=Toxoplasma gondii COUG TaxID=1074873 RepID=A0A2G8YA96_TOXGO|nr:hypothetical protein TGCOUG_233842 [Toxoplasma gondii COUG]